MKRTSTLTVKTNATSARNFSPMTRGLRLLTRLQRRQMSVLLANSSVHCPHWMKPLRRFSCACDEVAEGMLGNVTIFGGVRTTEFAVICSTPLARCRTRRTVPEDREIHYTCQRCTNCCRWPGVVRVGTEEVAAIAAHVGMGEEEFIALHTRLRPDRRGLSLLEMADGSCEWLDGRDCRLQSVKPAQCRAFPNSWNFPGWREKCEAVPSLV